MERERKELDKHDNKWMKMEHQNAKIFETVEIQKQKVRLAMTMEKASIMLQGTSLMDDERKKWFINKEITQRDKWDD